MIAVLKRGISKDKVEQLSNWLQEQYGVQASPIYGADTVIIGLVGDTSAIEIEDIQNHEWVERVTRVAEPYKKANRKFHPHDTIVNVNGVSIGGEKICVVAGPCSVESEEQIIHIAEKAKGSGASFLRGGAFKPRTSPYAFQGLKAEGLTYLKKAKEKTGLPVVSEITNPFHIDLFMEYVDIIQVGARNMQNFELLK